MAKLSLEKLEKELNANNFACKFSAKTNKVFIDEIKDGFMAYIFEGDNGFALVVRLKDGNGKSIDHKTYTQEQQTQCDDYKQLLVELLNETQVYLFKAGKRKEQPAQVQTEQKDDVSDLDLLNGDYFKE